jgi:hypothetical protein
MKSEGLNFLTGRAVLLPRYGPDELLRGNGERDLVDDCDDDE